MKPHAEAIAARMRYLPGVILAFAAPSGAADFGYSLRAGYVHSDNVGREASNEVSSGIGLLGGQLLARRPEGRIRYDVGANGAYEEIFDSGYSSAFVGNAYGSADLQIRPEVFEWNAQASLNQVRANLNRGFVPGNREDITTISTGPRFSAHFGNDGFATLQGHYQLVNFSERASDSDMFGGRFEIGRSNSRDDHLALAVSHDDIHYTSGTASGAVDYVRRELFVTWRHKGARTELHTDVGASEIKGSGFDSSGPLYRINISRRITPFLSGFLAASRTFPTSPSSLLPSSFLITSGASGDIVGVDPSIATAAARRLEQVGGGLQLKRPRTSLDLTFTRSQEKGIAPPPNSDRTFNEVLANVSHQLTRRVYGTLFADYVRDKETNQSLSVRETVYGISLGMRATRSLSVEAALQHRDRTDNTPLGQFDERRAGIYLFYGQGSAFASPERHRPE